MKRNGYNVLFMDDEAGDRTAVAVNTAVEALRQMGHDVTVVTRMSEALDAFYHRYYHVFILDIDMAKVEDSLKWRGTGVAEVLKCLDSGAAVVMYSAAGTLDDWFRVANRHVYGYVFKGDSDAVAQLMRMVDAAVRDTSGILLPSPQHGGDILIHSDLETGIPEDAVRQMIAKIGDFQLTFTDFGEMPKRLAEPEKTWVAGIALKSRFDTRPASMEIARKVASVQPNPNIVFGCRGDERNRASILSIVNCRPFRLVDLNPPHAVDTLEQAVRDALRWYSGWESFPASPGCERYVHKALADVDWESLEEIYAEDGTNYEPLEEDSATDTQTQNV
jgi:CheY-like chemotaxis protein